MGGWAGGPADRLLLYSEAILIDGAVTEVAKWAVRRPRPYTYDARLGEADDDLSFFSGHTSWLAAASFSTARSIDLTTSPSLGARIGLYGSAAAVTAVMGAMRVAAGMHYPSDVLVGAAVGASIGWLVPELHRSERMRWVATTSLGDSARLTLTGSW
jgi:membrane-associated phospholipid phosphatase